MPEKKKKIVAVIDIGSSAMRMVIAEIDPKGEWRRLDRAFRPIPLGRDVFTTGYIQRDTTLTALRILAGYQEMLAGWQVEKSDVRIIATAAIREAKNRDTFIDRVLLRTGLRINVIEGIEENHLTYLAVEHAVKPIWHDLSRTNTLIIEVGGGTTEIMLLQRGRMVSAHSLKIGTVRLEQHLNPASQHYSDLEGYIRENVRNQQDILQNEFKLSRIKYFVAVGGDARLVAQQVGVKTDEHFWTVDRDAFLAFLERMQNLAAEDIVRELQVTYNEAEGLVPALFVYKHFLYATMAAELIVPDVSIREGVILSFALGISKEVQRHFNAQVVASSISLGRKFRFDEKHGRHVARLAIEIYDQFAAEQGLGAHERLLIEAAGIMHDIGNFIHPGGHHKHGQYIIANSEVFGLSRPDIRIVSNVVRYHRKNMPVTSHLDYISLRREERIIVLKLAAMLRVADGLDRGHSQRVRSIKLDKGDDEIVFKMECDGDPMVERTGFKLKSVMFEGVFGYKVRLD